METDFVLDLDSDYLPPNVRRELPNGLDFDGFYLWEAFGGTLWWWVRPA